MKVLITGATGLLGSHIVDSALKKGYKVRVFVRKTSDMSYLSNLDIEIAYGTLSDQESLLLATENIDIVYHSAARVSDWGTRQQFIETNYIGTKNIIDACKKNFVKRLIYISSPSVVFDYKDEINIDETYPYPKKFANYYSEAKALAEKDVTAAHNPGSLETVILRPHAIWGPRDKTGVFPRLLLKIKEGKLKNFSEGKKVFVDTSYVTNAADACILAGESKTAGGKIYFIANDDPIDIWSFMDKICETFKIKPIEKTISQKFLKFIVAIIEFIWKLPYIAKNFPPPLTKYAIGILTHSTTYDLSAAKKDLNYKPSVNNEEGVRKLKEWVDQIGGLDEFFRNAE